jgi:hypothetical protein
MTQTETMTYPHSLDDVRQAFKRGIGKKVQYHLYSEYGENAKPRIIELSDVLPEGAHVTLNNEAFVVQDYFLNPQNSGLRLAALCYPAHQ